MYGLHSIGGYDVGELLKRYADLIGMEIDTVYLQWIMHSDGSGDKSHTIVDKKKNR
jgi:hypothetical protein